MKKIFLLFLLPLLLASGLQAQFLHDNGDTYYFDLNTANAGFNGANWESDGGVSGGAAGKWDTDNITLSNGATQSSLGGTIVYGPLSDDWFCGFDTNQIGYCDDPPSQLPGPVTDRWLRFGSKGSTLDITIHFKNYFEKFNRLQFDVDAILYELNASETSSVTTVKFRKGTSGPFTTLYSFVDPIYFTGNNWTDLVPDSTYAVSAVDFHEEWQLRVSFNAQGGIGQVLYLNRFDISTSLVGETFPAICDTPYVDYYISADTIVPNPSNGFEAEMMSELTLDYCDGCQYTYAGWKVSWSRIEDGTTAFTEYIPNEDHLPGDSCVFRSQYAVTDIDACDLGTWLVEWQPQIIENYAPVDKEVSGNIYEVSSDDCCDLQAGQSNITCQINGTRFVEYSWEQPFTGCPECQCVEGWNLRWESPTGQYTYVYLDLDSLRTAGNCDPNHSVIYPLPDPCSLGEVKLRISEVIDTTICPGKGFTPHTITITECAGSVCALKASPEQPQTTYSGYYFTNSGSMNIKAEGIEAIQTVEIYDHFGNRILSQDAGGVDVIDVYLPQALPIVRVLVNGKLANVKYIAD